MIILKKIDYKEKKCLSMLIGCQNMITDTDYSLNNKANFTLYRFELEQKISVENNILE